MPEELLIALAVLVGAVWVCAKLFGFLSSAIGQVQKDMSHDLTRWRAERLVKRKASFAPYVQIVLPNEFARASKVLLKLETEFEHIQSETRWIPVRPSWEKRQFLKRPFCAQVVEYREMDISEIEDLLRPDDIPWFQIENAILKQSCAYPAEPPRSSLIGFHEYSVPPLTLAEATIEFDRSAIREKDFDRFFGEEFSKVQEYNRERSELLVRYADLKAQVRVWNASQREQWNSHAKECDRLLREELENYNLHSNKFEDECKSHREQFATSLQGFQESKKDAVIERVAHILGSLRLPNSIPRVWKADFDEEEGILIVEVALPDVVHRAPYKSIPQKNGPAKKPLNQSERKELVPKIHPAIMLRVAFELLRNDLSETIKLLALNGWVSFIDPTKGIETRAYTATLLVEQSQFLDMNLRMLDPLAAFQGLKGRSAGRIVEIIPIEPTLNLSKQDSRFVDGREVLNSLDHSTNLAAMDWQDFEHLIRELFEKEFSDRGGEVKITQASRDRGVDAIVFDPDPIHGGKYIIQAKRYTDTVDVSAVRDLCAVVRKEGASRGILVTTSTYGADAYAFANNEPVTLLNGAELLGLLRKHGYTFKINLQEARQLSRGLVKNDSEIPRSRS